MPDLPMITSFFPADVGGLCLLLHVHLLSKNTVL